MQIGSSGFVSLILVAVSISVGASDTASAKSVRRDMQPVMVGGMAEMDACSSTAYVKSLNPKGDGFLSVRAKPEVTGKELARIKPGQVVWLCDDSADGKWAGVVYLSGENGEGIWACNITSPDDVRRPYRGPCQSGWVARRFLELSAG